MLRRACVLVCVGLGFVVIDSHSLAARKPDLSLGSNDLILGGSSDFSKAVRDTHFLIGPLGSGASVNGQFQDGNGLPDWNGWTHRDLTQPSVSHWQLSDYHADNLPGGTGNIAAWCGDISFIPCWVGEPEGGYGNSWYDIIEWRATVPDPSVGVDVTFTAVANIDSEPGYDGTEIVYYDVDGRILAAYFDGLHPALPIDVTFSLAPEDYQGIGKNEVVIQVSFHSDSAWSDEDCQRPTAGAVQIDDITVTLNQGEEDVVSTTDFESGWGDWTVILPTGVGDFAQIWTNLEDIDPCATNYSPQVAFIDDGIVVPGVGPSLCIDWCYGPGGYIVNTTGGALGEPHHLNNVVESPVIPWPSEQAEGAHLWFDVFHHEDLSSDSPGVFYFWNIRSTASEDPADIENAVWDNNQIYYFGQSRYYSRYVSDVSSLLDPGRRFVQVQLGLREIGYMWDWNGNDGYPAPYLDNVRLVAYPYAGPSISAREMNLAQDSFPASGTLDLEDLASNSVRFDMARNISLASEQVNLPGDSIVVDIVLLREGAELVGEPEIVVAMKANPVFDEFRILPAGLTQNGNLIEGAVPGVPAVNASGPVENQWAFDLPDENFFFPGDIIHYYIRATGTDGATQQTSTMPASDPETGLPMGFLDFLLPASCDRAYNSSFIVRALPSVYEIWPGELSTPKALVWNDFGNRVGVDDWFTFFAYRCLPPGEYYDIYTTNSPQSGLGNGLGGRATVETLAGYDAIFYTSGDLSFNTLSNGDFGNDAGNDLALLDDWLRLGNHDIFLSGDGLVFDLMVYAGSAGSQFVSDWMKVSFIDSNLRPLINNQATTMVWAIPGNGVFDWQENWFADGDCPGINTFDAVEVDNANGGERLAEFTDPNGNPGGYIYSAATLYSDPIHESKILSLPYDLRYVPSGGWELDSGRERILINAWQLFGLPYPGVVPTHCNDCGEFVSAPDPQEIPGSVQFGIRNYPNPFNPSTRIEYSIPQASHLTLKIFNLKGELVRTLIDEPVETSGSIEWDGTDNGGARVGSGVYFCQAQAGGKVQVQKLAIIK